MNLLVVPKPLFNSDMSVEGYYFSYQYGNAILEAAKSNPLDGAMHSPFIEFMNEVGLEALTQNNLIFIPVTQILLMTALEQECNAPPEKVALLIDRNAIMDETTLSRVRYFTGLGYKIALRQTDDLSQMLPYLSYADYVFLTLTPVELMAKMPYINANFKRVKLVATGIESQPEFDLIKNTSTSLFDGPFYKVHMPKTSRQNALTPLKVNYIQLLNIVNQNDFDFQAFTRIIRQDTALAIQFMRLVNSAGRSSTEIKNINQAAALLGQREIKKWVATAVANALCADKPSEITRVSLLRAKFCENMAKHFELAVVQDNLFLMGLLSVLDVILEVPMEEALTMVFVPEQVRRALGSGRGDFGRVLEFITMYEHGDWHEISRVALVKNISISNIHDAYLDAMLWYSNLINMPLKDNVEV